MVRPTEVIDFYLKNINYYRLRRKFTRYTLENNSSRQIVYNKIKDEEIKSRQSHRWDRHRGVAGWSVHYYLWACRRARSAVSD
jgi:hypothetical protein